MTTINQMCSACREWVNAALDDCPHCGQSLWWPAGVTLVDKPCEACGATTPWPEGDDPDDDMPLCRTCIHELVARA